MCPCLQAKEFEGQLPHIQNPTTQGERLHQVFQRLKAELDNVMAGYILPDPYFITRTQATVERMMTCLKDPSLPLLELQV
jgi:acetyl-CoA carboxylase/biotin carboxylase 1